MHTLAFTKMAMAMASAPGNLGEAADIAAQRWGAESAAAKATKAAIAATSTDTFATGLADDYGRAVAEFIALVRSKTIIGRLEGIRRVPADVKYLVQSGTASGSWVAEGKPMPLTSHAFVRKSLSLLKVAALTVQTEELLDSPDSADIIQADLVRAVAEAVDAAFIDPDNAGVAGEKPASVTNGVTPALIGAFDNTDIGTALADWPGDWDYLTFIAHPELVAFHDADTFPGFNVRGEGNIKGAKLITSTAVPKDASGGHQLIALDASAIAYTALDTAAQIKASHQGTLEMLDGSLTQDGTTGTGAALVSLWQNNLVAIAALLHENWRVERADTVRLLNTVGS